MLYIGLSVLVALLLVAVIVVLMQPSDFRIARATTIAAPAEAVFAQVNQLRQWEAWSPWAGLDPEMKQAYEGPSAGAGARTAWSGNKKAGEGSMTILESEPSQYVRIRLEFIRPFKATNIAEFTLTPESDGTRIEWAMTGRKDFMAKAFCLVADMDKLVGADFENGLSAIKRIVEAESTSPRSPEPAAVA